MKTINFLRQWLNLMEERENSTEERYTGFKFYL